MQKKKGKLSENDFEKMAEGKLKSDDFFGKGKMHAGFGTAERRAKPPEVEVQRVNIDFGNDMLTELEVMSVQLNISRQAVIKMLLRVGLDQHYLAIDAKKRA